MRFRIQVHEVVPVGQSKQHGMELQNQFHEALKDLSKQHWTETEMHGRGCWWGGWSFRRMVRDRKGGQKGPQGSPQHSPALASTGISWTKLSCLWMYPCNLLVWISLAVQHASPCPSPKTQRGPGQEMCHTQW